MSDWKSRLSEVDAKLPALKASRDVVGLATMLQQMGDEGVFINIKYEIIVLLGEIGDARAVNALIPELDDVCRDSAISALGKIRDRRAVEPLIRLLEHQNEGTRVLAIEALGAIGDKRAVNPLIAKLDDEGATWRNDTPEDMIDTTVKQAAADALDRITGKRWRTQKSKDQVKPWWRFWK